jgi:DNA-binding NarL/FixJ family response regulator
MHGFEPGRAPIVTSQQNQELVRVVVAEDNDDLRAVMPPLIEETGDLCCVATTGSLGEVAPLIERHAAHVAVLDIELHGGSVLKYLPALCRQFPDTRFVIHSGHSNPEVIRRVKEAGAAAYVLKSGDFDDLITAIRGVFSAQT